MGKVARLLVVQRRQDGVFARTQAREAGYTTREVDGRVASGAWTPQHRGVYLPKTWPVSPRQPIVAAWLAAGDDAFVSHRSAGVIWGLSVTPGPRPEVTVPASRTVAVPGIRVYRSSLVGGAEAGTYEGVRVSSPARTLLDLASVVDDTTLEVVLDETIRERRTDIESLGAYLGRPEMRSRRGAGVLRELVALRSHGLVAESVLETKLFRILRQAGLPEPVLQFRIMTPHGPRRIDGAYPRERVALEGDGYLSHSSRTRFDDDRARRSDLRSLGWSVVEVTWTMIEFRPLEVALAVGDALGLVPARWRPRPAGWKRASA